MNDEGPIGGVNQLGHVVLCVQELMIAGPPKPLSL